MEAKEAERKRTVMERGKLVPSLFRSKLHPGFRHPGTYPKKPRGFFGVHPPKKAHPPKPKLLL